MRKYILAGVAAAVFGIAGSAQAATVVFFSTFNGLQPLNTWSVVQSADGWTTTSGPGIELQNRVAGNPNTAALNDVFVELDSHYGPSGQNNSSMSRQITNAGSYLLEFLYSPRPGVSLQSNGIGVFLNNVQIPPTFEQAGGSQTSWSLKTIEFYAAANSTLTFSALGTSETLGGYVDDIKLTAVPEPSTWAMMIMGFGTAGALLRRRRVRAAG